MSGSCLDQFAAACHDAFECGIAAGTADVDRGFAADLHAACSRWVGIVDDEGGVGELEVGAD